MVHSFLDPLQERFQPCRLSPLEKPNLLIESSANVKLFRVHELKAGTPGKDTNRRIYDSNLYLGVTFFATHEVVTGGGDLLEEGGREVQEKGEQRKAIAQRNQAKATDMTPSSLKYSCLFLS